MNNRCPICCRPFPFPEAALQHIKDKNDEKHRNYRQNNIPSTCQLMPEKRRYWVFRLSLGDSGEPSKECPVYLDREDIRRYIHETTPIDDGNYPDLDMDILNDELFSKGKLRQGWGTEFDGMNLDLNLSNKIWLENYIKLSWRVWAEKINCEDATGRYDILKVLKDMKEGHIVFIPKIPDDNHFSVARVNKEGYHFQKLNGYLGHGHVIEVDKDKIKVFNYGNSDIERIMFMPYRKAVDEIKSHHLIYPTIIEFIEHHL